MNFILALIHAFYKTDRHLNPFSMIFRISLLRERRGTHDPGLTLMGVDAGKKESPALKPRPDHPGGDRAFVLASRHTTSKRR